MLIRWRWIKADVLLRNLFLAAASLIILPQAIAQNQVADTSPQGRVADLLSGVQWVVDPEPLEPFHQVSLELDAAEACVIVDETTTCNTAQLRVAKDTRSVAQIAPRNDFRFSNWLSGEGYIFGDDTHESVRLEASNPLPLI